MEIADYLRTVRRRWRWIALQTKEYSSSARLFVSTASGFVPSNAAELLQSNAMADVLRDFRAPYDFSAIDAPPLLPVTNAALIATKADGALLVVCHGRSTRDQVRHSIKRLTQVDASLEGVVLNMVPAKTKGYGYGCGTRPISRMAENGMGCALRALAGFVSGRTEITQ